MKRSTQDYLVALQDIIHNLLAEDAGSLSAEQAAINVAATARHIPPLDRAWRKEIGQ